MVGSQSESEDKVSLELSEEVLQSMEVGISFRDYNGRISSLDFHKSSSYLMTASDDESIRLYDVSAARYFFLRYKREMFFELASYVNLVPIRSTVHMSSCQENGHLQRMAPFQTPPSMGWLGIPGIPTAPVVKSVIILDVPGDKYPNFNFVGRILGPLGNSLKKS